VFGLAVAVKVVIAFALVPDPARLSTPFVEFTQAPAPLKVPLAVTVPVLVVVPEETLKVPVTTIVPLIDTVVSVRAPPNVVFAVIEALITLSVTVPVRPLKDPDPLRVHPEQADIVIFPAPVPFCTVPEFAKLPENVKVKVLSIFKIPDVSTVTEDTVPDPVRVSVIPACI